LLPFGQYAPAPKRQSRQEAESVFEALNEALELIQDCHATYIAADSEVRRLMNQAIFAQLLVRVDELEGSQAPVYAQLRTCGGSKPSPSTKGP